MYGTELTLLCYNESGPSPTSDEPLVVRARELVVRTRARRPIDLARPVRSERLRAVSDGPVLVAHVDELVVLDVRRRRSSRRVEVVAASLGLAIRVGDVADDALEGVEDTVTAGHGCGLVWSWKKRWWWRVREGVF